ncbi:hypothetical protein LSAT2_022856 [Lamellibrachia satsuma]|nr:hypothetical protein LSAT2_022856 [Lamellibrachia satsuma]
MLRRSFTERFYNTETMKTYISLAIVALVVLTIVSSAVACWPPVCPPSCPKGTFVSEIQENGRTVCKCVDPCKNKHCLPQETCVLKQVRCFRAPCPPIATCVPRELAVASSATACLKPVCPKFCPKGTFPTEIQENGCTVCRCVDPCKKHHCLPHEKCVPKNVVCVRAPCPPIASCVPACKGGMVWKTCGSACTPTCANPSPICIAMCTPPMCQCPSHRRILDNGRCITPAQCHN